MDNRDHQSSIVPKIAADLSLNRTNLTGRGLSLANEIMKDSILIHDLKNKLHLTLVPGLDMEFVRIPAGLFLMGSENTNEDATTDEKPQHEVSLNEYWVGKYPVTNAQYQVFIAVTGREPPSHWVEGNIPKNKANHPVVCVTWHNVRAFCKWISGIAEAEIRLPAEAEWEKAARGTDGRKYPWSENKLDGHLCNFNRNAGKNTSTTRVGRYSPAGDSPYNCADMVGNVWEWTNSLHEGYPYCIRDGRENTNKNGRRVVRGGSWFENDYWISTTKRFSLNPNYSYDSVGFRCVFKWED